MDIDKYLQLLQKHNEEQDLSNHVKLMRSIGLDPSKNKDFDSETFKKLCEVANLNSSNDLKIFMTLFNIGSIMALNEYLKELKNFNSAFKPSAQKNLSELFDKVADENREKSESLHEFLAKEAARNISKGDTTKNLKIIFSENYNKSLVLSDNNGQWVISGNLGGTSPMVELKRFHKCNYLNPLISYWAIINNETLTFYMINGHKFTVIYEAENNIFGIRESNDLTVYYSNYVWK